MTARNRAQTRDSGDAVAQMMAALLPIHAALTPGWLVDAACTAAERGLGASFSFVFLEREDGTLECQTPASDLRRRSHQRAVDALGTVIFRTPIDPKDSPQLCEALDAGTSVTSTLAGLFGPFVGEERASAAAEELGVEAVCLAPLATAGERLGVFMALGGSSLDAARLRLLADHVACAAVNLRNATRELGAVEAARAVFDARKLEAELQRELARAARYNRQVSICVIEATNLRLLRDRFGRALTDGLLEGLGDTLARHARDVDVLGAFKESGYTMILTEASGTGAEAAAGRLLQTALQAAADDNEHVPGLDLHLAVGWAACPQDGTASEALFAAAERRMYEAASQVA